MNKSIDAIVERVLDETRPAADADADEWGRRSADYLMLEYPDVAVAVMADWVTAKLEEAAQ